jgi:predicted MPP superfamily phosphohydrolase
MNRRRFLTLGAGALATAAGTGVYAWQIEPYWLEIVRRPMPLENLPPALAGRTLLQISDVHVWARLAQHRRGGRCLARGERRGDGRAAQRRAHHLARPETDAATALRLLHPGEPTVVLAHNPDVQDLPIWDGVRGWVLAGHTHGGQVKPPFLPPPVLPVRNKRYTSGVFAVGPGRTLYINRGLGFLIQVRFGVRPELTLFTLTPAAASS